MSTTKAMYRTILADHFPPEMTITFGDQKLVYRKRTWKIPDPKSGEVIESGLRYGENPDQEAALYELVNGNLVLGDCRFIQPGYGLHGQYAQQYEEVVLMTPMRIVFKNTQSIKRSARK